MKHLKDVYIGSEESRIRMRAHDNLPRRYRELSHYIGHSAVRLFRLYSANQAEEAWAEARKRYPECFEVRT